MNKKYKIPSFLVKQFEDDVLCGIMKYSSIIKNIVVSAPVPFLNGKFDKIFKKNGSNRKRCSADPVLEGTDKSYSDYLSTKYDCKDVVLYDFYDKFNYDMMLISDPSDLLLALLTNNESFRVELVNYEHVISCKNRFAAHSVYSCIRRYGYFKRISQEYEIFDFPYDDSHGSKDPRYFVLDNDDDLIIPENIEVKEFASNGDDYVDSVCITIWAYGDREGRNVKLSEFIRNREEHMALKKYMGFRKIRLDYWEDSFEDGLLQRSVMKLKEKYPKTDVKEMTAPVGRDMSFLKDLLSV